MAGKQLTEQEVLEILDIPDFRHMSKDKVMKFASELPNMDPQAAKTALLQFPEFAATTRDVMSCFQETMLEVLKEDQGNVKSFNESCDVILALLASLAEQSDISFEQKEKIIDKMIAIVQLKGNKDTETKKFKYKLLALLTGLLSVLALALLASLGGKAELHEGSEDEDEEN